MIELRPMQFAVTPLHHDQPTGAKIPAAPLAERRQNVRNLNLASENEAQARHVRLPMMHAKVETSHPIPINRRGWHLSHSTPRERESGGCRQYLRPAEVMTAGLTNPTRLVGPINSSSIS